MVCVIVTLYIKGGETINDEDSKNQILQLIGFQMDTQRDIIYDDSTNYFSESSMFAEKYISYLSNDFDGITKSNDRQNFNMYRTKRMKALLRWVQYFRRISEDAIIVDLNELTFIQKLYTNLHRVDIGNNIIYQKHKKDD